MRHHRLWRTSSGIAFLAAGLLTLGATAPASATTRVTKALTATGKAPGAHGQASLVVKSHSRGKLKVIGRHLAPNATFQVIVHTVPIGSLTTNAAGTGMAKFSAPAGAGTQALGVDPQGQLLEVRDDEGDDVLETEMPPDTGDAGDIQCCLGQGDQGENEGDQGQNDGGSQAQVECEETTPDECTAEGGVNMGAGSCLPNPCPSTSTDQIACCVPDDDQNGAECESATADECAAEQGVNLGAVACDPNPCAPTPPSAQEIACCVPDEDEVECEEQTADECTALGGTNLGAGTCDPNPCPAPPGDIQCCRVDDGVSECDEETADECTADGGTNLGAGTCDPNPCTS